MARKDHLDSKVRVVVEGVKKHDSASEHTVELHMDPTTSLEQLFEEIKNTGYQLPSFLRNGESTVEPSERKAVLTPYKKVEVVADRASESGKYIHEDEPLIFFANRNAKEMSIDLVRGTSERSSIAITDHNGLRITFHRTVRMPDDGRLHQLPASTGNFPLYNVGEYANILPDKMIDEGGIFLPMWQREALWLDFTCPEDQAYALRVFVGRVNAVSGKLMDEDRGPGSTDEDQPLQDYVVLPGQRWLDGICVAPGVVRQFVAMPLGSGYTVEGQKTGEEKFGGLQIEIIPRKKHHWFLGSEPQSDNFQFGSPYSDLDKEEHKTPAQLGLVPGTTLCFFESHPIQTHPYQLFDFQDDQQTTLHLKVGYRPIFRYKSNGARRCLESSNHNSYLESGLNSGMEDFVADLCYEDPSPSEEQTKTAIQRPTITKDLKTMGLAAGGRLVQDIYRDTQPGYIWNTAAARLVNVHILDPVSFETVTHTVPPPPPMDMEQYIKAELPFVVVEEDIFNRVDGGDFDHVKSVSAMDDSIGVVSEPSLDPTKPTMCLDCQIRLCDCVIRPCGHLLCNICIQKLEANHSETTTKQWKCPLCDTPVSHVAGFSAPMNLPGEETVKTKVPVQVLKVEDGRMKLESVMRMRV